MTCRTAVMIVEPPGAPRARTGLPSRRMIVGLIELRGRLFASGALVDGGTKSKSVSSLLSRNP